MSQGADSKASNGRADAGITESETSADGGGQEELCGDGTYSYSAHRRGTCSHHGGVAGRLAGAPS
ncbi:DUF3761 domain-containing protein [Streptomyces sp. NBC_00659]|uniref:DUF3761 domain-containing protein n=1 Tax=Streptomyces sp. NBC_00659 TaxID=2903669 RepID=UPI002E2F986F|nr:DUF3761 domain-containing protein [Streptomyces sp. NBC_00659]